MKIEQLRYEDLGLTQIAVNERNKPGVRFLIHFHHFVQLAYKNTIFSLKHLESKNILTTSTDYSINAISYWFFTIESFINTIWKVVSVIDSAIDFTSVRKKELSKRISDLLQLFDIDRKTFYKSGIFAL